MLARRESQIVIQKALLTALVLALVFSLPACGNNRRFDSQTWLKSNARERGRMAEALADSKLLVGQTVDEVRRVLGPPDIEYPTAFKYNIDLGWLFKKPETYGLLVYLDQHRNVREVKMVD